MDVEQKELRSKNIKSRRWPFWFFFSFVTALTDLRQSDGNVLWLGMSFYVSVSAIVGRKRAKNRTVSLVSVRTMEEALLLDQTSLLSRK